MKLALLGYGKMGKTIEKLAVAKGHEVVFTKGSNTSTGNLEDADAAIEFSSPEAAVANIKWGLEHSIPVISGTTGWLAEYGEIVKLCQKRNGSFIYASNFSIGVNLFFNINAYAAKLMAPWKEYDVAIEEIHHTEKKDVPSGTAISLAEDILPLSEKAQWKLDGIDKNELSISAKRINDVKGTHSVFYASEIDTITLRHEAHSREGFAKGAILATEWLQHKKGVFTMKDVLGLT